MSRSLTAVAFAGAVVMAIIAPVYGGHAGVVTAAFVAATSAVGLCVAHVAAARRTQRPLRMRFAIAVGLALAVVLTAVLAGSELMFVSRHDALMISAMVIGAAIVALRAARVASARVVDEVGSLRDALGAVASGERTVRVDLGAAAELRELALEANAMIEQLAREEARRDAAEEARRTLVAAVSHDLRTPLTSLRLLVDAIDDDIVDPATRRRYLSTMGTHVRALGSLIDDLFELSRIEAGDVEWSVQRVEIAQLVDEIAAAMRLEADAKGVAVRTELAGEVGVARGDPERLQRVLFNLIQNAIRHTPADGSVTVRAASAGRWVEVEVADTGEGIAAEDRAAVFRPFVRADAARTGAGAGLGLAISRAIVEAHGGRIWLEDGDGAGTRVRFAIPA